MNKKYLLEFSNNRVRRNYIGGRELDVIEGNLEPDDGNRPEDWIASTTEAKNPGLPEIPGEGLSRTIDETGKSIFIKDLFKKYPEHYLGHEHYEKLGPELGFLAKLLDSSMRLHVQAHPTAQFAQKYLNSRWGKLETYVILGHRDEYEPYIRLGFQRPPSPSEWKRIVLEQDIPAMDACFDKIPVKKGEVWVVPGGLPHAIGEGLLVMEVMEPTDLVVRCEFEREGIIVPPEARFMGHNLDFALQIFDYTPMPIEKLYKKCRIIPQTICKKNGFIQELLIGATQTDCFKEYRIMAFEPTVLALNRKINIVAVIEGTGEIISHGEKNVVKKGTNFMIAAAAEKIKIVTAAPLEMLMCTP